MKSKQQQSTAPEGTLQKKKQQQQQSSSESNGDRRLGSAEQQIGHVNWSATLRNDVWGDEMTRYVGINPKHSNGEDWRSPMMQIGNPKVHPPESLVLGTSSSTTADSGVGAVRADAASASASASDTVVATSIRR